MKRRRRQGRRQTKKKKAVKKTADKKEESSEPVLDIDELVKRIDAKIAQLEEEEAKERNMKNEAGECSAGERDRSAENKEG